MTIDEKITYLESAKLKQEAYRKRVFSEFGDCEHFRNISKFCDHHIMLMDRDIDRLKSTGWSLVEKGLNEFCK